MSALRLALPLALLCLSCAERAGGSAQDDALVVALAPPVGADQDLARRLAPVLAEEANALGLRVVSDPEVGLSLAALAGRRPADPLTARLAEASFQSERARVHRALYERFDAGHVLYAEVVAREASFADGIARWDGVRCEIEADGEPVARGYAGQVEALSLRVWLEDQDASLVAEAFGGLELCASFRGGRWRSVAPEERLRDDERLRAGARAALTELLRAP